MRKLDSLQSAINNAWKIPSYFNFYNKKNKTSKKINSLKDLKRFPILNKQKYFDLFNKKEVFNGNNIYLIKSMLNSDGEEAVFPLSKRDYQNYVLFEKRKWQLIGVNKTDICSIVAFSQNHTIPMAESFLALGASYFPLDGDQVKIFKDIIKYKVTVLFTIPPVVEKLMEYVEENKLKTSLRLVITTGVKIPDVEVFHKEIKSKLGAELIDTIGSAELASFAFSCRKNRNLYHLVDQQQIVEILDVETGKETDDGEIVITPLWKLDYPLIRYSCSDLVHIDRKHECNCQLRDKKVISNIRRKSENEVRIERYLLDLEDFYFKVRDSLLWQNFVDKKLWSFLEKPEIVVLVTKVDHKDRVLVFIEKNKFVFSLRRRSLVEETVFNMSNAESKIILCQKGELQSISKKYQDLRHIKKNRLKKKIKNLLSYVEA